MKVTDEVVRREIAGETLLIPVGETALRLNGLVSLNETGAFLWDMLKEECSPEELTGALCREFDVSAETASADVAAFLAQVEKAGLLA